MKDNEERKNPASRANNIVKRPGVGNQQPPKPLPRRDRKGPTYPDYGRVNKKPVNKEETKDENDKSNLTKAEKKEIMNKLDKGLVEQIRSTVIDKGPGIGWNDIEGL